MDIGPVDIEELFRIGQFGGEVPDDRDPPAPAALLNSWLEASPHFTVGFCYWLGRKGPRWAGSCTTWFRFSSGCRTRNVADCRS